MLKAEQERRRYLIERVYDAQAKRTELSGRASLMTITKGEKLRQWLSVSVDYAGEKPAGVESFYAVIETAFTGTRYRNVKQITMEADGRAFTFALAAYSNRFRTSGSIRKRTRKDDETLRLTVPIEAGRVIGAAKKVTGTVGGNSFTLTRDQREAFAAMVKELGG